MKYIFIEFKFDYNFNSPKAQPSSSASSNQIQNVQSATLPRNTNVAGGIQVAAATAKQFSTHQHTASWSYYPDGKKIVGDNYANYYHLPAHARHSYHGHEAIYQNCHTMTLQHSPQQQQQQQQQIPPQQPHVHQKMPIAQAPAQVQTQYNRFARSPTRTRPESPPPLRSNFQTMVLIPYNSQAYAETSETGIYQRQNIVEYQQASK